MIYFSVKHHAICFEKRFKIGRIMILPPISCVPSLFQITITILIFNRVTLYRNSPVCIFPRPFVINSIMQFIFDFFNCQFRETHATKFCNNIIDNFLIVDFLPQPIFYKFLAVIPSDMLFVCIIDFVKAKIIIIVIFDCFYMICCAEI